MPRSGVSSTPRASASARSTRARETESSASTAPVKRGRGKTTALVMPAASTDEEDESEDEQPAAADDDADDAADSDADASDEEDAGHTAAAAASNSRAAAAASPDEDDFDLSALVASASASLVSKLRTPAAAVAAASLSTKAAAAAARRGAKNSSKEVASASDLNDLFSSLNGSSLSSRQSTVAASDAATVPAGFVRKNGVLRLTTQEEAAAAVQTSEAPIGATAPDLLASIGASTRLDKLNPVQQKKEHAAARQPTAGKSWFNFSRPSVVTQEMKRDLQLLSLRAYMDPKKFYKKESRKKKLVPTFFQMGTVIEGAQDFYSSRIAKKDRTEHYVDDFVNASANRGEVKKTKNYLKRKAIEVQKANAPAPKFFNKKRKMMDDASKRPGGASGKKKKHGGR